MCPASRGSPSVAVHTGAAVQRAMMSASRLREDAGMCSTTQTAIGRSVGNADMKRRSASIPPAEAPMATTPRGSGTGVVPPQAAYAHFGPAYGYP